MMIIHCEPPALSPPRNDFTELFRSLKSNPNTWMRVPLAELTGKTDELKRISVRASLACRGLRVITKMDGAFIFVKAVATAKGATQCS